MFPLLGSAIGGLFSFLGAGQTASANQQAVESTNATNAALAQAQMNFNAQTNQENRAFQQYNSNTAYERASADMQAAGLNPAMMFSSGSAAGSPTGSNLGGGGAATMQPARSNAGAGMSTIGKSVGDMISSAVQAKTIDKMVESISNLEAERAETIARTGLIGAQTKTEHERPELIQTETGRGKQEVDIARSKTQIYQNAAKTAANLMDMDPTVRKLLDWGAFGGKALGDTISPVLNMWNSAKSTPWARRSTSETTRDDGSSSFTERWGY